MNYDIPESVDELFANGERSYSIIDYTIPPMDNIQSMEFFLNAIGANNEDIAEVYDTQVYLKHKNYPHQMCINSGGLGDFYSHGFDVCIYNESV